MASIKDVAHAAGVSTATVSRVLSNKPHVRPAIRERVMQTVKKLDYRPNRAARSLRTQQTNTIGLIVSDIRNSYFTSLSRAVEDVAYDQGISVYLCNTDENPQKEAMYLESMHAENVAGIIFSPTRQAADNFLELNLKMPTVIVDRSVKSPDVDSIGIDNVTAGYRLTQHLIENGYQRIMGIFGEASTTGRERREGYLQALQAANITPSAKWSIFVPPKVESGSSAALQLLDAKEPPDAILTTNSLLTAGALKAIRKRKLTIPDDVALVGFDEVTWSSLVQPAITVMAQPTYEIGQTATELLFKRLKDSSRSARKIILQAQLIERASSARRQPVEKH